MSAIGSTTSVGRRIVTAGVEKLTNRLDGNSSIEEAAQSEEPEIVDAETQIADMEEEATSAAAQFVRLRGTDRRSRRSSDLERILDSDPEEKLDELNALLGQRGGKINVAMLLRDTRERFRDPSDLVLALRELRRRRRNENESVDGIDEAIESLLADPYRKTRIKAGINVALKAKLLGRQMNIDPRLLRDLYRQFLEFGGFYLVVYEDWIEQFGYRRRKRILRFVTAALKCDMQSLDPSFSSGDEFGPLMTTLYLAQTLSSADEKFVNCFLRDELARDSGFEEAQVLTAMLGGLQRPFAIGEVLLNAFGNQLTYLDISRRSHMLQLIRCAFAGIPVLLFETVDARHAVIETLASLIAKTFNIERKRARPHMRDS